MQSTQRPALAVMLSLASSLIWSTEVGAQSIREVTLAAPDIIAVEIRDPAFVAGHIERLEKPSAEPQGTWINVNRTWGRVVGPDKNYLRTSDIPPTSFLNRALIDNASGYSPISGRKVTAVYRKSVPYDSGIYRGSDGETMIGGVLKHYVYLKLAQPLAEGLHTIRWPDHAFPDTDFTVSDTKNHAIAIRANQHGYRGSDIGKVAYLALWLPGGPHEGAVDFRQYGLRKFHVIDASGKSVFESDIRLRMSPGDPEFGNGLPTQLLDYPSATGTPTRILAVSATKPVRLTAPGHGFSEGQRVWLDKFTGASSRLNGFATVGKTTDRTFELVDVDGAGANIPTDASAVALPAHQANRAATFVFELDFSAWQPETSGDYRVQIPGLGVSDVFSVRDDVWLKAGQMSIGGLYNHRSGIALDGRFGYKRPASFRPGQSIRVRVSRLPEIWSSNADIGFIPSDHGASKPWITNEDAPLSYWGGYMDAGDWDRRIDHVVISNLMLDVFEGISSTMRSMPLGIPKSSDVLDRDLYSEIDDVSDLVHEAIWNLDFYRRLQMPDGGVRGGIESAGHPLLGEPSFLEHQTVYTYAPDHVTSYRYAAAAAKLAIVLNGLNRPRVSEVFRESAIKAWQYAENVSQNAQAYYADAVSIANAAGYFDAVSWQVRSAAIRKAASEYRLAAAATLFRMTRETGYRDAFEAGWGTGRELHTHIADAAWEYANADPKIANPGIQARIRQMFITAAGSIAEAQTKVAYPSMKHPYAPIGWGQGLAPDYNQSQMFIRAHRISGDPKLLRVMQIASAHILGANQVGLSFTTGLGHRTIKHPLHEDHRAMGIEAPLGITSYGWGPQSKTSYEWIFGPYWSALPVSGTKEFAENRRVEPDRFAMPFYDYLIEHPAVVMQQEYTVQQTIGTTAAIWLYLHAQGATNSLPN